MKISEVIKYLNELLEKEGDLDVTCWPYDGQDRTYDVNKFEVRNYSEETNHRGKLIHPSRRAVSIESE